MPWSGLGAQRDTMMPRARKILQIYTLFCSGLHEVAAGLLVGQLLLEAEDSEGGCTQEDACCSVCR